MGFFKRLFGGQDNEPQQTTPKAAQHELEENRHYYFPKDENDIAMMKTNIAGLNYRMKMEDARKPYQGHTKFEPDNPVNEKAVALITDDGRHIGYVKDSDLRMYYDMFSKRDGIRFYGAVGIFTNDKNKKTLFGNIMLVDIPESDDGRLFNLAQKQLDFMMAEFSTE